MTKTIFFSLLLSVLFISDAAFGYEFATHGSITCQAFSTRYLHSHDIAARQGLADYSTRGFFVDVVAGGYNYNGSYA